MAELVAVTVVAEARGGPETLLAGPSTRLVPACTALLNPFAFDGRAQTQAHQEKAMAISGIAIFVACVVILLYGYLRNNRNMMLCAAIALFLSTGLREFFWRCSAGTERLSGWLSQRLGGSWSQCQG